MIANPKHRHPGDRRLRDIGPPKTCAERRRLAERRIPEVSEIQVSANDWDRYFNHTTFATDQRSAEAEFVAEVFGRNSH